MSVIIQSRYTKYHFKPTVKDVLVLIHNTILRKLRAAVKFDFNPSCTVKCWLSFCTEWRVYTVCVHVFSYCCGKQVVFFSHSRRLLKQRAFSVNLSISAATPLTAGWRAGCEVGKAHYKHTRLHLHMRTMEELPGERCGRWLMYLFMWMGSA